MPGVATGAIATMSASTAARLRSARADDTPAGSPDTCASNWRIVIPAFSFVPNAGQ